MHLKKKMNALILQDYLSSCKITGGCAILVSRLQEVIDCHAITKGMYNGSILAMPRRLNDEVEEREIIREGLSSLN